MSMRIKSKVSVGILTAGGLIGGLAWATPVFNLASPVLATGTHNSDIETHGRFETSNGEFRVSLRTEGPSTVVMQDAAFSPGGHNGWHSHAGMVAVTLVAGSIDWYDEDCKKTSYKAGDTWTEGSQVHYFKSTSPVNLHLFSTFTIAQGSALRIDEPAPGCAAALGLD